MNQPDILPAPILDFPRTAESKWEREYQAFLRQKAELLRTHRNRYVAIHDGHVVASGDRVEDVAMCAYSRFGYVPIYVGLVTDQPERPVRMPSPRVVGPEGSR